MVVIAESTRQLFSAISLSLKTLGRRNSRVSPVRCGPGRLRASAVESRFEALHTAGRRSWSGAKKNSNCCCGAGRRAKTGEGHVVLLSGEPGIGKSRLTAALSEHIGERTPYPPTLFLLAAPPRQRALSVHCPARTRRRVSRATIRPTPSSASCRRCWRWTPQMTTISYCSSQLLSLPSSAADLNLSPQRKREKLFEALLNQLEAEARRRPVLMVFEDAHWIDPTSRELLDLAVDQVRRLPVLLAITFRPEFQPPWSGRAHVTSLALNRLGERAGEALVHTLAGNARAQRRDGSGDRRAHRRGAAVCRGADQGGAGKRRTGRPHCRGSGTASQTALSVPATLHASLMARLDRLGPSAKEIAQIGAVLGREFGYELIEPVAQRPESESCKPPWTSSASPGCCSAVVSRRIRPTCSSTRWCRTPPTRPCCAGDGRNCTPASLRRWRRISRDLVERQPELLAHHLSAAGDTERAVDQWLKAGQRAAGGLAHVEAIAHFERGLGLLASLPIPRREMRAKSSFSSPWASL